MANECEIYREEMHRALDDELGPEERARFDGHLTACPTCRREYEALTGAVAAFEAAPRLEPSPAFSAGVMRRVRAAEARRAKTRRFFSWAAAGATAAVAAGSIAFWGRVFRPALSAAASSWVADVVRVASDGWKVVRAFTLPASVLAKVGSALGTAASYLVRDAIQAASPVYLGAFVAIALFYLLWRVGSRAATPLVRTI
jgi:anti-sigma factor RsiW